jgi:hypothetical protein
MPKKMTEEEVQTHLEKAVEVERYDSENPDDPDDSINAVLYRASSGQLFRYVEMSGMSSTFCGAFGFGDWITEDELESWREF